jgi:glucan-binding YG repeat protein
MAKYKRIVSLILLYVLVLSLLPVGILGHTVEAASANLKKISMDNPYYVIGAVQYKDKAFIIGRELDEKDEYQKAEVVVRTEEGTKTLIPVSELEGRYVRIIGESESKLYIEAITESSDPAASDVYIIDKNTEQIEKQTLEDFYAPFLQAINADTSSFFEYYRSVYISKNDTIWVVFEKFSTYDDNDEEIPGTVFITNSKGLVKEIPYQQDEYGYYEPPIGVVSIDREGNLYYEVEDGLIKVQPNGAETSYGLPEGIGLYQFDFDSSGNVYAEYYKEQDEDYGSYIGVLQNSNGQFIFIKNNIDIYSWVVDNNGNIWSQKCVETPDSEWCETATIGRLDSNFNFHDLYTVEYNHPYNGRFSVYDDIVLAYSSRGYGFSTNSREIYSRWVQEGDKWYYIDETGAKKKGWLELNGEWYYLDPDTGAMQTGWVEVDGKQYYLGENGVKYTGWVEIDGNQYYLGEDGAKRTGWVKVDNNWYYLGQNGVKQIGWVKDGGKWYYLNDEGVMQTGWISDKGKWYYLDASGAMKTGWLQSGGKWYYLNPSGEMATGWKQISGKWYYFDASGAMKTGWLQSGGKWYYLNPSGDMAAGWKQISGKWYYFDASGVMKTGWLQSSGKWYYLNPGGDMATGWKKINNKWYYFYNDGSMAYNTVIQGYKLGKDGAMIP